MFVILTTYLKPLSEVDKYLEQHRAFLKKHYATRKLIASGPLSPRTGGVILSVASTRDEVEAIVQQDPFYENKIAHYDILEFDPVLCDPALKDILKRD